MLFFLHCVHLHSFILIIFLTLLFFCLLFHSTFVSHGFETVFCYSDKFVFISCIFATVLICDWLRCVMWRCAPPTCPLVSRLQWAALSGLWVRAMPPQALQPLAGCTGAFPGQVPFTTCVPPLPPVQKTPGVVYFFSLAQRSGLPA